MAGLLVFTVILLVSIISVVQAQVGCNSYFNNAYYDAAYDFTTGASRDSLPTITRIQNFGGTGCSTRIVLKLTFSKKVTNQRLLIDLFFTSPTGHTFNLGDSSTNNGFAGDAATQSRDAELQLVNGRLDGFRSDFGGSGPAFNLTVPSTLTRMTLLVSNYQTIWTFNGDPLTVNFYNSPSWFALDGQPDTEGPVNYDLYLGVNRVIYGFGRDGSGLCKIGLKWVNVY